MTDLEALNAQVIATYPDLIARLSERGVTAHEGDEGTVRVPTPGGYVLIAPDLGGYYASTWTDAGEPATDDNWLYASPVDDEDYTSGADLADLIDTIVTATEGATS